MLSRIVFVLLVVLFVDTTLVYASTTSSHPFVYVVDETGLLATSSRQLIEGDLRAFHVLKYGDAYVRLVNSLHGTPIQIAAEHYIQALSSKGEGNPKIALLLISIGDRQARIAVSKSMSPLVTDVSASAVLVDNLMVPMSKGQIAVGVRNTVEALTDLIKERHDLEIGSQDAVEIRGADIALSLFSISSLFSFAFVLLSTWFVSHFARRKIRNLEIVFSLAGGVLFSLVGGFGSVVGGLVFATPILVGVVYFYVHYARKEKLVR